MDEESLIGFFKKPADNQPLFGYVLNEFTFGYQLATSFMNFELLPSYFNSTPKNGTVFRFSPNYSVGVNEIDLGFKTYPNPVAEVLYISNAENKIINCEIINLKGKIIQQFASTDPTVVVDCSEFSSGTYFLKIFVDDQVITKSIIKQ